MVCSSDGGTHFFEISQITYIKRIRQAGHCLRSNDQLINDFISLTSTHGCARVNRPTNTNIHHLYTDTGCCLEDLRGVMNDKDIL